MPVELCILSALSYITAIAVIFFLALIFLYLSTDPYPVLNSLNENDGFIDPVTLKCTLLPFCLNQKPEKEISIIIPAYNEADRLPKMLSNTLDYLKRRKDRDENFSFEIIIVNDGSRDKTEELALNFSKNEDVDTVRVLSFKRNRGKGAAVRSGMLSARGKFILFADADNATYFPDIEKLESALYSVSNKWNQSMTVVCGSRAHLEKSVVAERHPLRNLLMHGFRFCVWLSGVRGVRDTQCGFKLFGRSAARILFHNLHVERWAFDVELLYLARYFNMNIMEVPVQWKEVSGSKLIPVLSWLQMGKDLLMIRLRYSLGTWKIQHINNGGKPNIPID